MDDSITEQLLGKSSIDFAAQDQTASVTFRRKASDYQYSGRQVWEINPENVILEEFLGHGAYGAVYKGNWSGTDVAVKIVQEDLVYQTAGFEQNEDEKVDIDAAMKVFWAEIELMRTLAHPNVVQFLGACTRRHPRMLLMEFLPNGTLDEVFEEVSANRKPLGLDLATKYAVDIAKGMAYLHHNPQRTVIHRDIKPGNLLLDKTGSVKVADFGLSKAVDESLSQLQIRSPGKNLSRLSMKMSTESLGEGNAPFEQRGYQVGTYIYMPAELFRSKSDYTSKVDVYSFAMILYELYEGRQPFEEYVANPMYAAAAAATGLRPEMQRAPSVVRSLIEKCWAENPSDRPTFLQVLKELSDIDAMIRYDKSIKSKVTVFIHYGINILLFTMTCVIAALEYMRLSDARHDGDLLCEQGRKVGLISKNGQNAFDDPLVVGIQDLIPSVMVLSSFMFVIFPNKKIRAIAKRGPKFSRRGGLWIVCQKCCGGALEVLRRLTLVSAILSIAAIILQYECEKYILDTMCNGDAKPFEPEPGIDKNLCIQNYTHSHYAILFQAFLFALNIIQLLFHHFGIPEPKVLAKRFDTNFVAMKLRAEQNTNASNGSAVSDDSPKLKHPINAREFYKIKKTPSQASII